MPQNPKQDLSMQRSIQLLLLPYSAYLRVIRQRRPVINADMDSGVGLMNSGCNVSHKNWPVIQHATNIGDKAPPYVSGSYWLSILM